MNFPQKFANYIFVILAIVHINSSKFRPQLIKMSGNNDDLDSTLVPSANERFIQTIPLKEFSDSNDDYCVYFITTLPGCGEYVLEVNSLYVLVLN